MRTAPPSARRYSGRSRTSTRTAGTALPSRAPRTSQAERDDEEHAQDQRGDRAGHGEDDEELRALLHPDQGQGNDRSASA